MVREKVPEMSAWIEFNMGEGSDTKRIVLLSYVCSAAKCHEHHEIFTNENNAHIRGSLMLIADTDTDTMCVMTCRTHHAN